MSGHEKARINTTTQRLQAYLQEAVKTHSVYDGSSRLTDFYVAPSQTQHGETCLRTRYTYVGATNLVENSVDQESTWNSAWDI